MLGIEQPQQQNKDPNLIGFLNMVNQIGREVRPDLFDDSRKIDCSEPGKFEFVNFMMDDSVEPVKVYSTRSLDKKDSPTLATLGIQEQDKVTMQTVIENVLKDQDKKEEQEISNKFIHLFKKLETDVNNIIDKLKTMANKLLIDLFANKNQINHITGESWRNFGETLLNTPTYIFSDYTKLNENDKKVKDDIYLIYKGGNFYTVDINNNKEKLFDVKHAKYPDTHFSSPVTIEHLVAIVELARQTHKVVRAFGSCHSWSPIHTSDGILVDNRKFASVGGKHEIKINKNDPRTKHSTISKKNELKTTVTTSPGITTGDLETQLWKLDYSLEASTIEDVFTIGGIGFTSSHGTGKKFTVASDLIVGMTIVCSNGKVVEISPQECVEVNGNERKPATWLLERDGKKLSPEDIWRTAQVNLGAFGIIYDMTLIIQPKMTALFVSEAGKWEEYFGSSPSCLEKLSKLNDEWDTLEFWHYPLTVKELDKPSTLEILTGKVTYCPYVTITKTMTDKLSPSQQEKYNVVEKKVDSSEFISQLAFQSVGSKFAAKFWKWANKVYENKITRKLGRLLIKYILVFTGWVGKIRWGKEPVLDKEGNVIQKGEVWSVPQYFANHPVIDATSVVEKIPCLDIEWEVPVPTFQDKSGLKHTVEVYGHLIRNVRDAFNRQEYPVSINVEMRFLRGSNSPLSMQYNQQPLFDSEDGGEIVSKGFAAPEIVSMSPNPWWVEFYKKMNHEITTDHKTFGENIRVHHAKQYSSLEGMLKYLREIYDNPKFSPYDNKDFNTSYKIWREVRTRFDQSKMFLNPHIDQLFYNHKDTYSNPNGYEVKEQGGIVPKKNGGCIVF